MIDMRQYGSVENDSLLITFYLIYSCVEDLPVAERLLSIWNDIKKLKKLGKLAQV